jgi:hypothetical protein
VSIRKSTISHILKHLLENPDGFTANELRILMRDRDITDIRKALLKLEEKQIIRKIGKCRNMSQIWLHEKYTETEKVSTKNTKPVGDSSWNKNLFPVIARWDNIRVGMPIQQRQRGYMGTIHEIHDDHILILRETGRIWKSKKSDITRFRIPE